MFLFFTVFRWLRRVVYVLILGAFVYLVATSVQVVTSSRASRSPTAVRAASAIVVAAVPVPGGPSGELSDRCGQTAVLVHARRSDQVIVLSDGPGVAGTRGAGSLASCLRHDGVPAWRISTVATAALSAQLDSVASRLGSGASVILVDEPLETKWVLSVASAVHLQAEASPAPAPRVGFWSTIGTVWDQTLRVAAGRVVGFSNTAWAGG